MWIDEPWQDTVDARWSNVWSLFTQALGCTLRGHRLRSYEPVAVEDRLRTCLRCGRRWTWQPSDHAAPPAGPAGRED